MLISNKTLLYLNEPLLMFGHGQIMEDPKNGLTLFGPLYDNHKPAEIKIGVIGREAGIDRYQRWVKSINSYIPPERSNTPHQIAFPGFETIFNCKWPIEPICKLVIPDNLIEECLYREDRPDAIYHTVGLYVNELERYLREEDVSADIWYVIIPEAIYTYCRPKSVIPKDLRIPSEIKMKRSEALQAEHEPFLFEEYNKAAEFYKYELHFHNQLKARMLVNKAVIQIIRETTLTPEDFHKNGNPLLLKRHLQSASSVAWNLSTTTYFKAFGKPWKLANTRLGVCYVGLVFKQDLTSSTPNNACCGAQMFLDSGDGLVFRGAVGPWYSENRREYHLPFKESAELMNMVIESYKREHRILPKELFIHGRTRFNEEEWSGFKSAITKETNIVGVRIRDDYTLKLYGGGKIPVVRGTAFQSSEKKGFLWTRGYIPKLQTYEGREVPNPLSIEICKGEGDLEQVMKDILSLTKVNYNACIYADGRPVTIRFADMVGDILTATPLTPNLPPLPFKHYI